MAGTVVAPLLPFRTPWSGLYLCLRVALRNCRIARVLLVLVLTFVFIDAFANSVVVWQLAVMAGTASFLLLFGLNVRFTHERLRAADPGCAKEIMPPKEPLVIVVWVVAGFFFVWAVAFLQFFVPLGVALASILVVLALGHGLLATLTLHGRVPWFAVLGGAAWMAMAQAGLVLTICTTYTWITAQLFSRKEMYSSAFTKGVGDGRIIMMLDVLVIGALAYSVLLFLCVLWLALPWLIVQARVPDPMPDELD